MFEHLAQYKKIAVTGPARSGTTICSQSIAFDTGHDLIDESEYLHLLNRKPKSLRNFYWSQFNRPHGVVVHSPAMLHMLMQERREDILVVVMRRPLIDIHSSEHHIGMPIDFNNAETKYNYIDHAAKPNLYIEINYEDLLTHPLWKDREDRVYNPWQENMPAFFYDKMYYPENISWINAQGKTI